ncbi:MAG: FAD-dependent oxidoreductase [Comamonadaceae bacterium]|nr:FAD-dependent oxidoreductase [Comamonadaceae bacterium]
MLVIDATSLDARALGSAAVLAARALAAGRGRADRRRAARQHDDRAAPAGRADRPRSGLPERRRCHPVAGQHPGRQAAARRAARLQARAAGPRRRPATARAWCTRRETWCRIARLFAARIGREVADLDASLLTLRRGLAQRGLVEFERADNLRRLIDGWGGGVEAKASGPGDDPVLVFDDGLGGFLPLSQADLSCEPLAFTAAGIAPAPSTLMVLAAGTCVVKQTRRALYRHWQLAEGEAPAVRGLLARVARLTTEITLGRGDAGHLAALDELALDLAAQGLAAAWPLGSSLRHFRAQWEQHVRRESCPEGLCLDLPHHAAPCHGTCPANIDIPSFMAHLGHGDYRATIEVIRRDNPLPLTCGLVCPAPCESACVRGSHDGAVFIRPLKAMAAEHCLADGGYPRPEIAPDSGKRIGIVGSGPAGLTAAYYLRTHGHQVEIFEAQEHAGGMLRYGIPAYRLPPELLEQELEQIKVLGIPIHTGAKIDRLEDFRKNYDAVFVGPGTQTARLLPIDGAHHPFVLGGIDFLRAVRSGEPVRVGPRVVVVGGGNVAIDVALTALRQGAKQRRPGVAGEAPRDAGQPARDRGGRRRGRAAARRLGAAAHRGGGPGGLPVLRARQGRDRQVRPEVRHRAAADAGGGPRDPGHRPGHRPGAAGRQRCGGRARLHHRRPEDADDQRAGRLRRRRWAARPAHGGGGDPRRQDRRRLDRRLAARHGHGRDDGQAGAPRRGDPDRGRGEAAHAPAARRDAREERRGGAGPGQLRAHRGRPERRMPRRTRCAAACAATSASAAACAWRPAARWASRRCAWATPAPAGWPTSTSSARPSCASAAAPARRCARPARSSWKTWTACGAPIITGTVVCEQPLLAVRRRGPADCRRRRTATTSASACRRTWRRIWTARSVRRVRGCGVIGRASPT